MLINLNIHVYLYNSGKDLDWKFSLKHTEISRKSLKLVSQGGNKAYDLQMQSLVYFKLWVHALEFVSIDRLFSCPSSPPSATLGFNDELLSNVFWHCFSLHLEIDAEPDKSRRNFI